jgi:hypothetical protein
MKPSPKMIRLLSGIAAAGARPDEDADARRQRIAERLLAAGIDPGTALRLAALFIPHDTEGPPPCAPNPR